ncbi:MAG: chitobiase/beta-hexosaminidase C-terminal domain-containing protein [Verrucomicrobia bacterium]|nr:chitobiase/beta-hexosaminidase C-terminal domain-containing protein [Verrucomicrobiota bacterium]
MYSAAHFTDVPFTISEIRHRRDWSTGAFTNWTLDVQLTLATTSRAPDALSDTFDDNLGPDARIVLEGPVTISSPSPTVSGGPQPFDLIFPLATPFRYDPALGNLLYEIRTRSTPGPLFTDASNAADDRAARGYSFGESSSQVAYRDTIAEIVLLVVELESVPCTSTPGRFLLLPLTVTLTTPVVTAAIHYTTDGDEPTPASPRYTEPFLVTRSATVQVRAFLDGEPASDIIRATYLEAVWDDGIPAPWREQYFGAAWYANADAAPLADADADGANNYQEFLSQTDPTHPGSVPDPILPLLALAPPSGTYVGEVALTASTPIPAGQIRFTRDGSDPGPDSEVYPGTPLMLLEPATIRARVYVNGNPASGVEEVRYAVLPVTPSLVSSPVAATAYVGEPFTLQVLAKGTPPLTYQWWRNGLELAGATASTLAFAAVTYDDAGAYTVQVRNAYGSVTSDPAQLAVEARLTPPVILVQPEPQMVALGGTVVFRVEATGTEPLRYQWHHRFVPLTGETGSVLTLRHAIMAYTGSYNVLVYNDFGSVMSSGGELVVTELPVPASILIDPVSMARTEGDPAWVQVGATGTAPLYYVWRRNGQPIPDADASLLRWPAVAADHAGTYTVTVTNEAGSATSAAAIIAVRPRAPGGAVLLNNRFSPVLDAPIFDTDGVTRLVGPAFLAQLYAGPTPAPLEPVGVVVPFLPEPPVTSCRDQAATSSPCPRLPRARPHTSRCASGRVPAAPPSNRRTARVAASASRLSSPWSLARSTFPLEGLLCSPNSSPSASPGKPSRRWSP